MKSRRASIDSSLICHGIMTSALTLLASASAFAADPTEYVIKASSDPFVREGFLSAESVAIGNAVILGNSAISRSCIKAKTVTETRPSQRYILEANFNGYSGEVRLIAMGILKTQSVEANPSVTKKFGAPGTDRFRYACGNAYISSVKLGGQMILTSFLRSKEGIGGAVVPYTRIEANSAEEAKSLIAPMVEKMLSSYESSGGQVSYNDPRAADVLIGQALDLSFSVDRATQYVDSLLSTPAEKILATFPLSVMVAPY